MAQTAARYPAPGPADLACWRVDFNPLTHQGTQCDDGLVSLSMKDRRGDRLAKRYDRVLNIETIIAGQVGGRCQETESIEQDTTNTIFQKANASSILILGNDSASYQP